MGIRVVQWTTGNIGRQSVQAIAGRDDLELVGCYAWSPDKVGRDVGELAGIGPIGVAATDDVDGSLPVSCQPKSGSRFKIGKTTVRCEATDSSGNTAKAAFRVTVRPRQ